MTQQALSIEAVIARELTIQPAQVRAAVRLLDDGATVPFIARYRKEATQGLDDAKLRDLTDRLQYLRELDERRSVILQSIKTQEKLTRILEDAILAADTKTRLEDLYLPYRPKRGNKAQSAREAGLEPLAKALWQSPHLIPEAEAEAYINKDAAIDSVALALQGARHILMEHFSEDAQLLKELRQHLWSHGVLTAEVNKKQQHHQKYADYFEYAEPVKKIPSHRALALFRARREGVLRLTLTLPNDADYGPKKLAAFFNLAYEGEHSSPWLIETIIQTWKTKLFNKLELELLTRLREMADEQAIKVFAANLRDLLLAAPAGPQVTIGLDPGIRTGVKAAVVDGTGQLLDYATVFPFAPNNAWQEAITTLTKLAAKYDARLISVGNGTASRDTDRLVREMISRYPDLSLKHVIVSEAGASVYSASKLASEELPDVDVSIRGAVSIARRLQDPLAELVKIEPKSIGVGQYQHDVNQIRLARCLEGVIEDCVNAVGVDVNTASVSLLTYVAGIHQTLANNIVQYRNESGPFTNREQLKLVPRMGEKAFQQCAGFLRLRHGDNPLDASAVHPESYPLVANILSDHKLTLDEVMGKRSILQAVDAQKYVTEQYGLPTIRDVLEELEKPGRDPRPTFKTAQFKEGVEDIQQLALGMILEGVVSNVTNFGAFVDIGVHQDGLIHISALTDRYVADPRTVVKAGDVVCVKVTEIDLARRRIGLSMKLEQANESPGKNKQISSIKPKMHKAEKQKKYTAKKSPTQDNARQAKKSPVFNTAMADAFAKLRQEGS